MWRSFATDLRSKLSNAALRGAWTDNLDIDAMLPNHATIAAARSFADLTDVAACFRQMRSHIEESTRAHPPHPRGNAGPAAEGRGGDDTTFLRCVLALSEPSTRLLLSADVDRMALALANQRAIEICQSARRIAERFCERFRGAGCGVGDVVESLESDPRAALLDSTLNKAAVHHVATTLRVTLVLRVGPSGSPCVVFPHLDLDDVESAAAVLVVSSTADGRGFAIAQDGPTLGHVRRHLASEPAVRKMADDLIGRWSSSSSAAKARRTVTELSPLAAAVALERPGGNPRYLGFRTKSDLVEALDALFFRSS